MSRAIVALALCVASLGALAAQNISLPNKADSLRFAVIGDSGTGDDAQYKIGSQLTAARARFPFEFVKNEPGMPNAVSGSKSARSAAV